MIIAMTFFCYRLMTIRMISSFGLIMSYGNELSPCLSLVGQSKIIFLKSIHGAVTGHWALRIVHSHTCHP